MIESIVAGVLFLLLLLVLAGAGLLRMACVRQRPEKTAASMPKELEAYAAQMQEGREWWRAQKTERVSIRSRDGLTLRARYLSAEKPRAAAVLVHGYRSSGEHDFCCVLRFYHERGVSVLVVDQRACGESDGRYITFGVKERFDCADWARYLDEKLGGSLPIVLHGMSLGASTVLMASALPLPASVRAVAADCGYTSPVAIIKYVMHTAFGMPSFPALPLLRIAARLAAGFSLRAADASEAVKRTHLPIFFLHGAADHFVPLWMGVKNYDACASAKRLVVVQGASHGMSYLVDPARCQYELMSFLREHLRWDQDGV